MNLAKNSFFKLADTIDIVNDPISSSDYKEEEDPTVFVSSKSGRGPLSTDWLKAPGTSSTSSAAGSANSTPSRQVGVAKQVGGAKDSQVAMSAVSDKPRTIMCAYKLCKVCVILVVYF